MIGACDICNAQNVELSRSELAGMETWSCTDGCDPTAAEDDSVPDGWLPDGSWKP